MSKTTPSNAVAEEVRALMARKRISQGVVAEALGISQSSMSRRLQGESAFTVDEIYRIADLFRVDVRSLLTERTEAASA